MTRLILAVRREARDRAPPSLFEDIKAIPGVQVIGEWGGRQLQVEASDSARQEIERRYGTLLHVEAKGLYRPSSGTD